jgi:hypothetical protein
MEVFSTVLSFLVATSGIVESLFIASGKYHWAEKAEIVSTFF